MAIWSTAPDGSNPIRPRLPGTNPAGRYLPYPQGGGCKRRDRGCSHPNCCDYDFWTIQVLQQTLWTGSSELTAILWCGPEVRAKAQAYGLLRNLFSIWKRWFPHPGQIPKGSDSMLLLEWLIFTLKLNLQSPAVEGHSGLLKRMLQLCQASLSLKMIHSHKLWLERDCARQLYAHIMTTLRAYAVCARDAIALKVQAFRLKPKFHALHHIGVFLKSQLVRGNTLICNPQMYACEPNEDFVGRISRLSRKVNIRLCDKRVYERYFLKVVSLLRRRKRLQVKRKIGKTPNLWSQICDDFYSTWSWNLGAHVFPAAPVATPCQWRTQRIIRISKRRCFRCWWGCH